MSEKIFSAQSNYGFGLTFNATGKAPLISKRIFSTYDDAYAYAMDPKDSAIPGLMLTVIADTDPLKNGLYFIKAASGSDDVEGLVGPFATVEDVNNATPAIEYDKSISDNASDEKAPTTKAVKTYVDGVQNTVKEIINDLQDAVDAIETWKLEVISADDASKDNFGLTEINSKTIYLVPSETTADKNIYKEYIYVNSKWELLGEVPAEVDLSGVEGRIITLETGYAAIAQRVSSVEDRLEEIVTAGGEPNKVNGITLNGKELTPDEDKIINITLESLSTADIDGVIG